MAGCGFRVRSTQLGAFGFYLTQPLWFRQPSACLVRRPRVAGRRTNPWPVDLGVERRVAANSRHEVLLPVLAARDGDSRGRPGWQCESRPRLQLCAVHRHAVFSQLSVEPRERGQQCGRDTEASLRRRRPCHHDSQPRPAGHKPAVHDLQADHGRHRRRARLRGNPFSIRPGCGCAPWTRGRYFHLQAQVACAQRSRLTQLQSPATSAIQLDDEPQARVRHRTLHPRRIHLPLECGECYPGVR